MSRARPPRLDLEPAPSPVRALPIALAALVMGLVAAVLALARREPPQFFAPTPSARSSSDFPEGFVELVDAPSATSRAEGR